MEEHIKKLPKSQVKITFSVTSDETAQFYEKALENLSKTLKIKGFRAGHIPEDIVKQHVSPEAIEIEMMDQLVPHFYMQIVQKHSLRPIDSPQLNILKREPHEIELTVDVYPEVSLKNVESIKVKSNTVKVEKKQIDEYVALLMQQLAEYKVANRASKKGDRIEIDFEGKMDGVPFKGGSSKHHPVIIGSNSLVPGFEDQLIGLKKDDKKTITVTFPKDYHAVELRGKKVDFDIMVHQVDEVQLPKLDDDFAKKVTGDDKMTKEKLLEEIEHNLQMRKEQEESERFENAVLEELFKRTTLELPKCLMDDELHYMMNMFTKRLTNQGYDVESYLKTQNKSQDELFEEWKGTAEKRVVMRLGLSELASTLNIEINIEELDKQMQDIPENERQNKRNMVEWQMKLDKTLQYLLTKAKS